MHYYACKKTYSSLKEDLTICIQYDMIRHHTDLHLKTDEQAVSLI